MGKNVEPYSDVAFSRLMRACEGLPLMGMMEKFHPFLKPLEGTPDTLFVLESLNTMTTQFMQVVKGLWSTGDYEKAGKLYRAAAVYFVGETDAAAATDADTPTVKNETVVEVINAS